MGSWGVTIMESDYSLDLLGTIVSTQLKDADFSTVIAADALELIKADIMEEIRRANRGCSAADLVYYFSENFPQNFTQGALLVAECLADYYRTGKLVVYEYTRKSCEPVEHRIKLFIVTEADLKLLLDELQSVQNPEHWLYRSWFRDETREEWLAHSRAYTKQLFCLLMIKCADSCSAKPQFCSRQHHMCCDSACIHISADSSVGLILPAGDFIIANHQSNGRTKIPRGISQSWQRNTTKMVSLGPMQKHRPYLFDRLR